jgi:hypothetical protein
MVNFRYHVVSIVAVFLALGIGVLMGATVIDRATVQIQNANLDRLEKNLNDRRDKVNELSAQLDVWNRFGDEARRDLLDGRLRGVPVLVVGVDGIDRHPVDQLNALLASAGASAQGTLWFTGKMNLNDPNDVTALGTLTSVLSTRPDTLRRGVFSSLATTLLGEAPAGQNFIVGLRDGGFLKYDPPANSTVKLEALPVPGTRIVVIGGTGADVPDAALTLPLIQRLAETKAVPLVAAEAGKPRAGKTPEIRAAFVGPIRDDATVAARVSTVDDLELFVGQVATVLAVEDLTRATIGHYGIGPRAGSLLPVPAVG